MPAGREYIDMEIIEKGDTVLVHFTSRTAEGTPFESSKEGEPEIVKIGDEKINPEFEERLLGMAPGDKITVSLPAEKAYGKYRKSLVVRLKKKKLNLSKDPEPGEYLKISLGGDKSGLARVVKTSGQYITVDANHPMAGEEMIYELEVVAITAKCGDDDTG